MDYIEKCRIRAQMDELSESIEKMFRRYNVYLEIVEGFLGNNRFIFVIKLKRGTRVQQVNARMQDVQLRLKFSLFVLYKRKFEICLVVSKQAIKYNHLPQLLNTSSYKNASKGMQLPYAVGYNTLGDLVVDDLCDFPHLLVGGASNSGKTVSLKSLITSIAFSKPPCCVNLVLVDVGANDLMSFNNLPHLSCPIIRDRDKVYQVLLLLKREMERRINLQASASHGYEMLPRIIIVVDEFPALFSEIEDRQVIRLVVEAVSSLLQRGRHAKMHVILAAQNPTLQNMRVDLGNITARMAFKCAKRNFSEVILGESGAENLLGQGDMYFKSPQDCEPQRMHGTFISPGKLQQMVSEIKLKWGQKADAGKFIINHSDFEQEEIGCTKDLIRNHVDVKAEVSNRLLSRVALWALGQNSVSCNLIMNQFNVGWHRADRIIKCLNDLGIVGDLDAKLPRKVLPQNIEEVPKKAMEFLLMSFAMLWLEKRNRNLISGAYIWYINLYIMSINGETYRKCV